MTSKIITITSKNQITLPAAMVRELKLGKNRQLQATLTNNGLRLRVEPSLEERMQKHWDSFHQTHPGFKPSGKNIHTEVSDTYESYFEQSK